MDFGKSLTSNNVSDLCYELERVSSWGFLDNGKNIMRFALPRFFLQVTLLLLVSRCVFYILKPLQQPRVVSEIISGIILGPTVLGEGNSSKLFPVEGKQIMETLANIGLIYYFFTLGILQDPYVFKSIGRKGLLISTLGMIIPFTVATSAISAAEASGGQDNDGSIIVYGSLICSMTTFPVVAQMLGELNLLNSELGKVAISTSIVNDVATWLLMTLNTAISVGKRKPFMFVGVILTTLMFVMVIVYVVRPMVLWVVRRTPEGKPVPEVYILGILGLVLMFAFISTLIGWNGIFGGLIFGLVIPPGPPLGAALIEKLEGLVLGILMPTFFALSGSRTNFRPLVDQARVAVAMLIAMMVGYAGKIVGTLLPAFFFCNVDLRDGFVLGLIMSSKGLFELIVLNIWRDAMVLNDQSLDTILISTLLVTSIVTPAVAALYKPLLYNIPYKRRKVLHPHPDAELRIVACLHNHINVPTLISLMEGSRATRASLLSFIPLHLVELRGRAAPVLIDHSKPFNKDHVQNNSEAAVILEAFKKYSRRNRGVLVYPMTAISPFSTMHLEICYLAQERRASLIILPFHKQQTVAGDMEPVNLSFRSVNQHVLEHAPCSVGIFVDRGLGSPNAASHIAVVFFSGPHDREALAYGARLADHPRFCLTVVRLIADDIDEDPFDIDKEADDKLLGEVRLNNLDNERFLYMEKEVKSVEELVDELRCLGNICNLFIVGRLSTKESSHVAGLKAWSEFPELGAVGDMLASQDFSVSVLVMQQFRVLKESKHSSMRSRWRDGNSLDGSSRDFMANWKANGPLDEDENILEYD